MNSSRTILTVGVIGFGNMGESLARGIAKAGHKLLVIDKDQDKVRKGEESLGISSRNGALDRLFEEADMVILAVKPQDLDALLDAIVPYHGGKEIISIAAGKSLEALAEKLPDARLCRFMPSIASRVEKSFTAVSFPDVDEDFRERCLALARTSGEAIVVPERLIAAVIGVAGSGIAFVLDFIDAMARAGVREGLYYNDALRAVLQTLSGAVELLDQGKQHPQDLVNQVCSPGGTTIEGVMALEEKGFRHAVSEAVRASVTKARTMES